ncbi:hypothetical protein BMS3Abin04_00548 [bacterium BMS3Abin04]|nr:hypothetical protein BMS3Abin04_00548 [bacterium BMS3Abin04]
MIYLFTYFIGWIIGFGVYYFNPQFGFINSLLISHLVFTVGFFGLFNFVGHVILRKKIAEKIGWVSNGFQIELGLTSLGIGISGILCYWFRDGFWIATVIPFSSFLIGAGILHIFEIVKNKNYNSGNTWIILPDFLMPFTLIVLLIIK